MKEDAKMKKKRIYHNKTKVFIYWFRLLFYSQIKCKVAIAYEFEKNSVELAGLTLMTLKN